MKKKLFILIMGIIYLAICPPVGTAQTNNQLQLETISVFDRERPGNPAVTPDGRVIVTMSALSSPKVNVREILKDGTTRAFPNKKWSEKPGPDGVGITKTIGIRSTSDGTIWILDMGDIKNNPTLLPKLVGWDTKNDRLKKVIPISKDVLKNNPFLQDFAVDEKRNKMYIADMDFNEEEGKSEKPAIIVLDIDTGKAKRVLENAASLMPENEPIVIKGKPIGSVNRKGKKVIHYYGLNPVTIDLTNEWVYFGAMSGRSIYRIPAKMLSDSLEMKLSLEKQVEKYSSKPQSDGFVVDGKGNIYVTDVANSAIGVSNPEGYRVLIQDKEKLSWPDGLFLGNDGQLYITANELNTLPNLNFGKDESTPPYYVHRLKINTKTN
jgi:sugar lactone lactonase YvrE